LLRERPDLKLADIRGNVDTRIRKALDADGPYDAIVLAAAGIDRLERIDVVTQLLPLDVMLPAPGQAALAVQCRADTASLDLLKPLNHLETEIAVTAERAFLDWLGGGCSLPIAAYAHIDGQTLRLHGRVSAPNGSRQIDVEGDSENTVAAAQSLGRVLAKQALAQGAGELIGSDT
jgi:hydroxymethylbilane synthase